MRIVVMYGCRSSLRMRSIERTLRDPSLAVPRLAMLIVAPYARRDEDAWPSHRAFRQIHAKPMDSDLALWIFLAIMCVPLMVVLGMAARGRASRKWPGVEGTVLGAEVVAVTRKQGRAHAPVVRYRYEVNGRSYEGERIALGPPRSGSLASAEATLATYLDNEHVMVYYDPENPAKAVLERGVGGGVIFGIVLLGAFILLTIVVILLVAFAHC